MMSHARRRQQILLEIRAWMLRHGLLGLMLTLFCVALSGAAPAEAKGESTNVPAKVSVTTMPVKAADSNDKVEKKDLKPVKEKKVKKKVSGIVMFIRKDRMAVEYAANDAGGEDILLKLAKDVKFKGVKDGKEIKQGDRVEVKYTETYVEPEQQGGQTKVLSMTGTEVSLLQKAKKAPALPEGMLTS